MKTIPSSLLAHYQSSGTTLAQCLLITRADGEVFAFTTADRQLTYLGQPYVPGLNVSAVMQSAGLAVNNLEVTILYDDTFTKADFLGGRWDGAQWEMFELNWADTTQGSNTIGHYVTGDVRPGVSACIVEMRALSQFLQQPVGSITSKTCRARFADYPTPIYNARCRLSSASFIETGTITAVSSQQLATDSSRSEAADYFAEGILQFTAGENVGLSQKIKTHAVGGVFTFSLPFPFAIGIGDTYTVIAGCRKRLTEDCKDKFDNVLNFQGEPHLPGIDLATASPDAEAP